jgi:hypothetical protein
MTSFTGTSIIDASSLTETNSATLSMLFLFSVFSSSSFCRWIVASFFSLRYFAPFDLPLVVNRASVSLICF